jgi:hypothetical protein
MFEGKKIFVRTVLQVLELSFILDGGTKKKTHFLNTTMTGLYCDMQCGYSFSPFFQKDLRLRKKSLF